MGEALIIEARQERGCAIVTVAGEIDIATATRLRERLFELAAGGRPLVADLDQVRFIDSAGLSALVGAAKRAAAHGGSLHVVCARPQIRQLFRLTGLDRRLNAGPHPGRGPGCPAGGPEHTPLAGRGDGPDRRPRSRGGEDHEATRSGKGGSRLLARNRLPPTGVPCHEAVRAPGHAAPVHRRQTPMSGPVTGQPLAHLRELLASRPASQDRGP